MSHTPPSTNPSPRRNRLVYILSAVAVIIVLFFIFAPAEEAATPTVGETTSTSDAPNVVTETPPPAN